MLPLTQAVVIATVVLLLAALSSPLYSLLATRWSGGIMMSVWHTHVNTNLL